jgi:hypothetical protein
MFTIAKTIGAALFSFIGFIIDVVKRYPLQILLVLVCWYAFHKTMQHDAIVQEFQLYKSDIAHNAELRKIENEAQSKQAKADRDDLIAEHKQQLADANLNRERETKKLKGSINEISDSLTIYRDAIKLRNSSSGSAGMSEVAEDTAGLTEAERNCYTHLTTVIDACKVTDLDYKTLYKLYDKQCNVFGCE